MIFKLLIAPLMISIAIAGPDEAWRKSSDPLIMGSDFNTRMSALPLSGTVEIGPKFWSGSYWPNYMGGINIRWNAPGKPGFELTPPSKTRAMNMTQAQLEQLSPSEKYDLFLGNYDYPLKSEVSRTVDPKADDWSGICHGWAPAAVNHNEPTPKVMVNPDGILVPFGSSDIKGLISYYYAKKYKADDNYFVGRRCGGGRLSGGTKSCNQDLNAGAFHIIISNMLGIKKTGFVADVDRYKEVWNQPVTGYSSEIVQDNIAPSKQAAIGTVKEMKIKTRFYYVDESEKDTMEVAFGTLNQSVVFHDYTYRIELNAEGNIIGGSWTSSKRPDFLWNKTAVPEFLGEFARLPELLND